MPQVVHTHDIPARQPQYAQPLAQLHPAVWAGLQARGISRLFSHQAAAVDAVLGGQHVVVATSTASGKSLCYNIPVLQVGCGRREGGRVDNLSSGPSPVPGPAS
jgi:DEAD/DEAH box helicase domain-containing protein